MTAGLVALGAAVGAPARYFVDRRIQARRASVFPWGTLVVNVVGSSILGVLVGAGVTGGAAALVGTGFCGAFTTYSTFSLETYRLIESRSVALATINVLVSLVLTLAGASAGYLIGGWIA